MTGVSLSRTACAVLRELQTCAHPLRLSELQHRTNGQFDAGQLIGATLDLEVLGYIETKRTATDQSWRFMATSAGLGVTL